MTSVCGVLRSARSIARCFGVMSLVIGTAVPAIAQMYEPSSSDSKDPYPFGYVSFIGGATATGQRTPIFAVEYVDRVKDVLHGYASVTYVDDLMSDVMRGNLAALSTRLQTLTGAPWSFTGRDRGISLTFGGKLVIPSRSPIRAYIGGGGGILNIRRKITERTLGEVTESFVRDFGVSDGNIPVGSEDETMPVAEVIGGINVFVGRAYIDFSVRQRRAFHTIQPINYSQVSLGAGVRF